MLSQRRITLGSYTLRIRDKGKRGDREYYPLDNIPHSQKDLLNVLWEYISKIENHNQTGEVYSQAIDYKRDNRTVWGILKTGAYGIERDIHDIEDGNLTHHVTATEAVVLPFYFLIHVPTNNADEAILFFQRFGNQGIKETFCSSFKKYFSELCPSLIIEINSLVPAEIFEKFLNEGRVKQISFRSFTVPQDIADAYSSGGHTESEFGYAELVFHAKKSGSLPIVNKIRKFVDKQALNAKSLPEVFEIKSIPLDFQKAKVQITDHRGNIRTFDLSEVNSFRPYIDVTDEIKVEENGHPNIESLHAHTLRLLDEYLAQLGLDHGH